MIVHYTRSCWMHFSQRKSVTKWLVFLLAQVSLHSDLPIIPSLGHTCPAFGYSICLNFWAHRWKLWKVISWGLNIVNHENGCLELFHSALIEHHILSGWATHVFSEKNLFTFVIMRSLLEPGQRTALPEYEGVIERYYP